MKKPLDKKRAAVRLKEIADHISAAYSLLNGYDEWHALEADLPMKAALTEARHKTLDGFSITELARRRLKELTDKETERSTVQ
jgi:hypothetical protein